MLKHAEKPVGRYKGQPMSPDTVKKRVEFQGIPVRIDRPRGFEMCGTDDKGECWKRRYKVDYGYIPKTKGGDGDGLDVFLGPAKGVKDAYWAVQVKKDGSFDEYKCFLGFPSREAAIACYVEHIPRKLFKGMVTMKVEMMKALLGIDSDGLQKTAGMVAVSCFDELLKIAQIPDYADIDPKDIPETLHAPREYIRDKFRRAAEALKASVHTRS